MRTFVRNVRVNASNALVLSNLTDAVNASGIFTNVALSVRILDSVGAEFVPATDLPLDPTQDGVYAVTLTKEVAPFVDGQRYTAQLSGTMKDSANNDVDYYEQIPLLAGTQ